MPLDGVLETCDREHEGRALLRQVSDPNAGIAHAHDQSDDTVRTFTLEWLRAEPATDAFVVAHFTANPGAFAYVPKGAASPITCIYADDRIPRAQVTGSWNRLRVRIREQLATD